MTGWLWGRSRVGLRIHQGHRTKRGNPWTGETVKDTLSNPVYAGRVAINRDTDRKEVHEGIHEVLIDAETFDRLGVKNVLRGPGRAGRPSPARYCRASPSATGAAAGCGGARTHTPARTAPDAAATSAATTRPVLATSPASTPISSTKR